MLYLFTNINIFIIYCYLESLLNLILETLYNFNIVLCKSSYVYIDKNNIAFLYKLLIIIKLLI